MNQPISKWFWLSVAVGLVGWLGCTAILSQPPGSEAKQLNLKEGETTAFPGTDVRIEVRKVIDFTSQGCLGGPIGCPDQVQLKVSREQESQEVTLFFPHTQLQREQGIHEAAIFGYKITLTAIQGKQVALSLAVDK